jgi:hypothetical protein
VPEQDLVYGAGLDLAALDGAGDGHSPQFDGAQGGERPPISPDRRPSRPGYDCVGH